MESFKIYESLLLQQQQIQLQLSFLITLSSIQPILCFLNQHILFYFLRYSDQATHIQYPAYLLKAREDNF